MLMVSFIFARKFREAFVHAKYKPGLSACPNNPWQTVRSENLRKLRFCRGQLY